MPDKKVKITDSAYQNHLELTNEWENKLNSFKQKYIGGTNRGTTEPDSDFVRIGKLRKIEY